jgi:hypothetical protein
VEKEAILSYLKESLAQMQDWDKITTSVPGVKLVKIPGINAIPPRLGVEINPVDENGKPIKRGGALVLTNLDLYNRYIELMNNLKVKELLEAIEKIRNEGKEQDKSDSEQKILKI